MSKKYHSISTHNGHIRKERSCPYCTKGSVPVQDTLMKLSDKEIDDIMEDKKKK